jgi:3-hydroxybutyryl-CoA dehydrogenase
LNYSKEKNTRMPTTNPTKPIAIVGAGAMGSGIAQVAAQAGCSVILLDSQQEALDRSKAALQKVAARQVAKNRWSLDESEAIQARIHRTCEFEQVAECDLVIEAILEDLGAKTALFHSLEECVKPSTILATNTSSLSITALAGTLRHPQRCIGLHFFNPAPLMALVEIVPALQTSHDVIEQCQSWLMDWNKSAVIAKDTPGFIVNRLARPFYGEALRIAEEGEYGIQTIDSAMKAVGFRMGPFELMDLIGNDVNYAVTCTVFEAFYFDPRYQPSLIQKQHVDAGWLGKKTGRGYYTYLADGTRKAEPVPADLDEAAFADISNRILALLMNEAADALRLKIANERDLETAMTRGVNYPKGLLKWSNDWGISNVLSKLEAMQSTYGEDRYRPSPLLKEMAREGRAFNV